MSKRLRNLAACLVSSLLMLGVPFGAWAIKGVPYAEENVTVSTTAIGVTSGLCTTSGIKTQGMVEVLTESIRYTFTGTTPSSSSHIADAKDIIELDHPSLWKAVRAGSVDATVKVTCFQ